MPALEPGMSSNFQYLDILLLAMIAAFVILRLRGVLGRRTGNERRPTGLFGRREAKEEESDKIVELPARRGQQTDEAPDLAEEAETPLDAGLAQIHLADVTFDPDGFTRGAKGAFESVVGAFAAGDTDVLRPLLSNEVFDNFGAAIEARAEAGQTLETTVVGVSVAEIIEAHMQGRSAFVTVKFVSEQTNVTRGAAGEVVDGDPTRVRVVTDIWAFARNTRSRDPNWTLVETRSQS
jgi:predicted lipid-binding transport protein (Tim44 family)